MAIPHLPSNGHVALQRTNNFVGRTMNWLYDHLRFVPGYSTLVFCDTLENRNEFPELVAWEYKSTDYPRRIWRKLTGSAFYAHEIYKLRKHSLRVFHSHFGGVALGDFSLSKLLGVPWLVSFYGADIYVTSHQPDQQQRYTRLFDEAARVLALGPEMAETLERVGCPRQKIVIHPLGVDVTGLPVADRVLKRGGTLRVLFAGTFREKKGIQYIIEAVALARSRGVSLELHLVGDASPKPGDAETKAEIFQRIGQFDLQDIVHHHSFISFHDLLDLALRSHVFVAPSVTASNGDSEGTPFVLQQMMATAMPTIATFHSNIPFLFGEHKHLLVPERDPRAIADRLICYADDPEKLREHGSLMRDRVRQALDVRVCAARLRDLYDSLW